MVEFTPSNLICVYVPTKHLERFITAISPFIPSFLGKYDHVCWWSAEGVEQSRRIGTEDAVKVLSQRVEISFPDNEDGINKFITNIIIPNHPWDEPIITITRQKIVNHGQ